MKASLQHINSMTEIMERIAWSISISNNENNRQQFISIGEMQTLDKIAILFMLLLQNLM